MAVLRVDDKLRLAGEVRRALTAAYGTGEWCKDGDREVKVIVVSDLVTVVRVRRAEGPRDFEVRVKEMR